MRNTKFWRTFERLNSDYYIDVHEGDVTLMVFWMGGGGSISRVTLTIEKELYTKLSIQKDSVKTTFPDDLIFVIIFFLVFFYGRDKNMSTQTSFLALLYRSFCSLLQFAYIMRFHRSVSCNIVQRNKFDSYPI